MVKNYGQFAEFYEAEVARLKAISDEETGDDLGYYITHISPDVDKMSEQNPMNFTQTTDLREKLDSITIETVIHRSELKSIALGELDGEKVAIKIGPYRHTQLRRAKEVNSLAELKNASKAGVTEFCVELIGAIPIAGVFRFYPNGDLRTLLEKEPSLSQEKRLQYMGQAAKALRFLHQEGYFHRNVRASNFLIDDKGKLKLGDFEHASRKDEDERNIYGDLEIQSPQVLRQVACRGDYREKLAKYKDATKTNFTEQDERYSFYLMVWHILTGKIAFKPTKDVEDKRGSFILFFMSVVVEQKRPELPKAIAPKLANLISYGWDDNPDKRPDLDRAINIFSSLEAGARP